MAKLIQKNQVNEMEKTMASIDLTDTEAETLKEILGSYLSDLRAEIADTDNMDFRESLKAKESFLNKLIAELGD